jgi:hypothetical protein
MSYHPVHPRVGEVEEFIMQQDYAAPRRDNNIHETSDQRGVDIDGSSDSTKDKITVVGVVDLNTPTFYNTNKNRIWLFVAILVVIVIILLVAMYYWYPPDMNVSPKAAVSTMFNQTCPSKTEVDDAALRSAERDKRVAARSKPVEPTSVQADTYRKPATTTTILKEENVTTVDDEMKYRRVEHARRQDIEAKQNTEQENTRIDEEENKRQDIEKIQPHEHEALKCAEEQMMDQPEEVSVFAPSVLPIYAPNAMQIAHAQMSVGINRADESDDEDTSKLLSTISDPNGSDNEGVDLDALWREMHE